MLERQKVEGEIQGAIKSRRPAQCESYTIYACNDLIFAFSVLLNNNELLKNVCTASLKKKGIFFIYVLLIILIFFPVVLNEEPGWLSLLLLIMNPIAINLVSTVIEKLFWSNE